MRVIARRAAAGFTLIELLTVIAIIGILAAILIPVVGRVRESARASQCVSNMRQIGTAMHLYMSDYGMMPPARDQSQTGLKVAIHHTLWTYVGFESSNSFIGGVNDGRANSENENVFHCPTTKRDPVKTPDASRIFNEGTRAWYSYAPNVLPAIIHHDGDFNRGADSPFPYESLMTPTQTVALVESSFWYIHGGWYHTRDGLMPHSEAANFLFYDNHVERIPYAQVPAYNGLGSGFFWGGRGNNRE
jgi:prepilin-type N-terminal cleavage/methylation domain-containing protein/prepilin-type processing-associated H-X9-DG protein